MPQSNPTPACHTAEQSRHAHDFGQGGKKRAETRAWQVTALTLVTMLAEVIAGWITGSMALLADGIHMAGHALALGLAAVAYSLTRRHAHDRRLSLGSGKISDLAAYTSALLLMLTTVWLIAESLRRLWTPEPLMAMEAMTVAVIGLIVNIASVFLLQGGHSHAHGHEHEHEHEHHDADPQHHTHQQDAPATDPNATGAAHSDAGAGDHNLRAALVHVMADAITSVAAIIGLLAAWRWGWNWLDPFIALVASVIIAKWSLGLLRQTAAVLLDAEAPAALRQQVATRLQLIDGTHINDLHVWSVGQGAWTVVASVTTHHPYSADDYRAQLSQLAGIHHPIIEVHRCKDCR